MIFIRTKLVTFNFRNYITLHWCLPQFYISPSPQNETSRNHLVYFLMYVILLWWNWQTFSIPMGIFFYGSKIYTTLEKKMWSIILEDEFTKKINPYNVFAVSFCQCFENDNQTNRKKFLRRWQFQLQDFNQNIKSLKICLCSPSLKTWKDKMSKKFYLGEYNCLLLFVLSPKFFHYIFFMFWPF